MNGELFRLAVQSIGRKKRSSGLLFSVLLLSFAFAIISLSVTGSISATNEEYRYDSYGTWFAAIPDGRAGDEAFLRGQEWLDELGTTINYGSIEAYISGSTSIGTVDEGFLEVGRISLQNGRFPSTANEIAMEADLLSALGYDYTLGQEITFTVDLPGIMYVRNDGSDESLAQSATVSVEQTYILCGVLREYADLWVQHSSSSSQTLNSALLTSEAAEALLQSAEVAAGELMERWNETLEEDDAGQQVVKIALNALVTQYYFSISPGYESEATEQLSTYIKSSRSALTEKGKITYNTYAFLGNEQEEDIEVYFAAVILAVTLLSVVCIYAIRIPDEARQLAVFRSIGITKRQLCVMLIYETLCLGIPAVVLGVGAGALGTWALLDLAMYSGPVVVQVLIPLTLLAVAAGLWLVGVLVVRLAVFLVALRSPLTGRFHVARKKARRYRNLQRILIAGLSALLCAAVIFTVVESLAPIHTIHYLNTLEDYTVTRKGGYNFYIPGLISYFPSEHEEYLFLDYTVEKDSAAPISQVPGVTRAWGWGAEYVRLDFDGIEEVPLAAAIREEMAELTRGFYNGQEKLPYGIGPYDQEALAVTLIVVDEGDWESIIDFDINMDDFRSGDAVLVSFCVDPNGKFITENTAYSTMQTYAQTGLSVGDTLRITAGTPEVYGTVETQVGGIITYTTTADTGGLAGLHYSYTVICSGTFLEKLLDALGPGEAWHEFRQGTPYGYEQVSVYVDQNADYLSTDVVLAEVCARENLRLDAQMHEIKQKWITQYTQTLILLISGGGCVALVLLLILGNTLSMEAERQKRNLGIQQALGMSRRQLNRRQFGTAIGRGVLGATLGWLAYGGYCMVYAMREQARQALLLLEDAEEAVAVPSIRELIAEKISVITKYWGDWQVILPLTVLCIVLVLLVSWLAKRRLTREDLMAKLRDEH